MQNYPKLQMHLCTYPPTRPTLAGGGSFYWKGRRNKMKGL